MITGLLCALLVGLVAMLIWRITLPPETDEEYFRRNPQAHTRTTYEGRVVVNPSHLSKMVCGEKCCPDRNTNAQP